MGNFSASMRLYCFVICKREGVLFAGPFYGLDYEAKAKCLSGLSLTSFVVQVGSEFRQTRHYNPFVGQRFCTSEIPPPEKKTLKEKAALL